MSARLRSNRINPYTLLTDDQLMGMVNLKDGSDVHSNAASEMHRRHVKDVTRICGRMLSDKSLVDDAVQETFINMLKGSHTFKPDISDPNRVKKWMYQIARNTCKEILRKRKSAGFKKTSQLPDHDELPEPKKIDPHTVASNRESLTKTKAAITSLSPLHREILQLVAAEKTYDEIADELDIPLGTVKSRLYAARRNLEKRLTP